MAASKVLVQNTTVPVNQTFDLVERGKPPHAPQLLCTYSTRRGAIGRFRHHQFLLAICPARTQWLRAQEWSSGHKPREASQSWIQTMRMHESSMELKLQMWSLAAWLIPDCAFYLFFPFRPISLACLVGFERTTEIFRTRGLRLEQHWSLLYGVVLIVMKDPLQRRTAILN